MKKQNLFFNQIILSLLFLLFIQINNCTSQNLNVGLVAYYPFNGNALDMSGYQNHGIVHGAKLTEDRFGEPNKAFSFDGYSTWIEIPDNDKWDFGANDFTICYWEYRPVYQGAKAVLARNNSQYSPYVIGYGYPEGNVMFTYMSSNGSRWNIVDRADMGNIEMNKWNFFAITRNGMNFKIYRNNILKSEFSSSLAFPNVSNPVQIGTTQENTTWFKGSLDDIRVYNRALTQNEIQNLYSLSDIASVQQSQQIYSRESFSTQDRLSSRPIQQPHKIDSKETIRDRTNQLNIRIDHIIDQTNREKSCPAKFIQIILSTKESFRKDPSSIDKTEEILSQIENNWQILQSILSSINHLSLQIEQLKNENINISSIEKALNESKDALEREDYNLSRSVLSDAVSNADNTWSAHQLIMQTRSLIKQIQEMGADVEKANAKLSEADEALKKGSASIAIERSREASTLAENANFGRINITDLRALASKYDRHTVTVSGTIRSIETIYGRGYKFALDDGSGLISVVYEGSLKGIVDGDDAIVQGVFNRSQDYIVATKVDKPSFFTINKIILLIILLMISALSYLFLKRNNIFFKKSH